MNNPRLRNRIAAAIASGATGLAIATVMIGSGNDGLEGIEHYPYKDVVGVTTVCYGHTGKDIVWGRYYSTSDCDALLKADLVKVSKQVDPLLKVTTTEPQKAAIYSFVYNVGIGAFRDSTMLRYINQGDMPAACDQLKRWVYAGGKKWNGLISRRDVEKQVCEWQVQPVKSLLSSESRSLSWRLPAFLRGNRLTPVGALNGSTVTERT